MITLKDVEHLCIINQNNVISDLNLLNKHLGRLIDFKSVSKGDKARIFYPLHDKRDDNGVTYTFGGYYGRVDYHLSNADILEWRDTHPECVWAGRVRDVIAMNDSKLSTYAGMQHCAELVAYEINCVAAALSDMGQNVIDNELLFRVSKALHKFTGSLTGCPIEKLKAAAGVVSDGFNETFQIVK
nr:MAG TPA: hypothetical protein [Caudoviricetes sp.]